ncbi:transcriptional regulator TACO1-like protein [Pseudomassariella vexata]|uniref:Transcriptional regulator TACO1-like protein n=1 Tax=Pseudomassariella vexata TaxID=1141098 RepID=A0A1Y2DWC8_9PEZI|nr:transcriptional regulator TACO1-like protein [Pseudomassariella vexata]ORY63499.1 transcriptional regulator TACO1-like protein [Pseudomassariella vexata]
MNRLSSSSSRCLDCRRAFSLSPALPSGHNRWSKIKHEKGAADQKKTAQRSIFSKNLTLYTKLYGPDPNLNSALANVIAVAKKAGMPKANIDLAVARGQGRSTTGEKLDSVMLEVMMPPSVALVIDIETDNKNRALQDLKLLVKKHNGTVTPTTFLFTKRGRTVLKSEAAGEEEFDNAFMQAVEAGAEDVEQDEEGNIVVWTRPNMTHQTAQSLSTAMKMEILTSDVMWVPNADKARVDNEEAAAALGDFLAAVRDNADVQAVYANAERGDVSEDVWRSVEENLDL